MANIKEMIITDLGIKDLANAKANEEAVHWTKFCVGDGNGQTPTFTPETTSLANETWCGDLTEKFVSSDDPKIVSLHGVVPSNVGGFFVREAGIKNEKDELVIVAQTNVAEKLSYEETGIVSELDLYFDLTVSNAEIIQVTVSSSNIYATTESVNNLREEINKKLQNLDGYAKETELQELKSTVQTLQGNVGTADEELGTLQSSMSTAEENIGTLQGEMTQAKQDITKAQGDITKAQGELTQAQTDITQAKQDISKAQEDITQAKSDIEGLQESVQTANSNYTSLEPRVQALETTLSGLAEKLEELI